MHERQAALAVVTLLFFSVIFSSESFAQVPQCNGLDATIIGTEDNDKIRGTSSNDVIVGLGGNDKIQGKGGNDIICGGEGDDKLYGNQGNDILIGGSGNDKIHGGNGFDTCDGIYDVYSHDDSHGDKVKQCEARYSQESEEKVEENSDNMVEQIEVLRNQLTEIMDKMTDLVVFWSEIKEIPEDIADGDDDTLAGLGCSIDEIAKWNGNDWICSSLEKVPSSQLFFQHSSTSGGTPEWVGTTNQIFKEADSDKAAFVMTSAGTLSNLMAVSGTSGGTTIPGGTESFTMTVIKNGVDSLLSCTITGEQTKCSDTTNKISVIQGDTILLRVDPSFNAQLVNIRISALLSPQ